MSDIIVTGKQEFLGKQVPIIKGGFGENQKCVLASTIAEIHGKEVKYINELIKNNIEEFEEGIDLLDLMSTDFKVVATDLGFIKSNNQKYCYLLSEQGYIALVGLMKTDKARAIRKEFRRNYFRMQEHIEVVAQTNNELSVQSKELLDSLDNKLGDLERYYRPTHKKKLDINKHIKNCLGVNSSRENADRVKEILLTELGLYKTYEEVPKDKLHSIETAKMIERICNNINTQFGLIQECMF
ncbi:ORF6N domain-containing protein [Clostridium sp. 1001283B150210_160208_E6]|uniref:ORF6N domain-containing protein n=1 Tax=Clostridium sp. 1001283B150210_160208_E6 TaxID=2787129 RepID=UPI0018ABBFE7